MCIRDSDELTKKIGETNSAISNNLARLKKKEIVDLSRRGTTWSMN